MGVPALPRPPSAPLPGGGGSALTSAAGGKPLSGPGPAVVWANWVLRLRAGGGLVGTVQATLTPVRDVAELAWVIGAPWQGRGFATEAARALAGWLSGLPVGRLVAHVHPGHAASAAVAAACGLHPTPYRQDGEVRWESGGGAGGGEDAVRQR
ncbi:GNAT family N-acetyltransferase [Streptomyces sp. NPDC058655]|uniref:GNAT family N-acetyltransferase n=1 Tax=Streptomyces sp. NPDC058655 TaxID=3346577 RepID=UPI003661179A